MTFSQSPQPSQIEAYEKIGEDCKQQADQLLANMSKFSTTKISEVEYTINETKFKLSISIARQTISKELPTIWYSQCIIPGNIEQVYRAWVNPNLRNMWDTVSVGIKYPLRPRTNEISKKTKKVSIANESKINSNVNENEPKVETGVETELFIVNSRTKSMSGGLISPRDFVSLLKVYHFYEEQQCNAIEIASKSVSDFRPLKNIPKHHIRGHNLLSSLLFQKIDSSSSMAKDLPKLKLKKENEDIDDINEENGGMVDWTSVRYLIQTDIKGWIPRAVIDSAMSQSMIQQFSEFRDYMFGTALKFNYKLKS